MSAPPAPALPPEQALLPARPAQTRALLVVLGAVATLAAFALLFARGAVRLDDVWSAQLSRTSTVQLLLSSEALRDAQTAEAQAILGEAVDGAEVYVLSREDSLRLIRPWLGDTALPDGLAVPGVLTVRSPSPLPVESLQRRFEAQGIRATIDDHSRFSSGLERTVGRLVLLGSALVGLTLLAATAVSAFATRAGLAAQATIIHVLVQAGASDRFIARLFVGRAARDGALGGAIGAAVGVAFWLFVSFGPGRGTLGWPGPLAAVADSVWLAGLVLAFALICALAAGWAAYRQLADERRRA